MKRTGHPPRRSSSVVKFRGWVLVRAHAGSHRFHVWEPWRNLWMFAGDMSVRDAVYMIRRELRTRAARVGER